MTEWYDIPIYRLTDAKFVQYTLSIPGEREERTVAKMDKNNAETLDRRLTDTEKDLMDTIAEVEANLIRHMNKGFEAMNKRMDNLESLTMMAVRASRQSQDILNILLDHQQRIETLESKMA